MHYEDHIIDQVQLGNDILDIIGQFLPTKRAGRNYKACCPFHSEKTPSFMINPEKQIFHCFGCGVGGNVFTFLMRYENITFPEAIRQLADRANIILPETKSFTRKGPNESEKLYEIYGIAADYYQKLFLGAQGKPAREYYLKREFLPEIAKELKVGWAQDSWRGLYEILNKKGFSDDLLLKSGLVYRSQKGSLYDAFRGRILFPIHNLQGKPVAFGGRLIVKGDGPKYLNSPENPIFHKRRELFGLHLAKRSIDRDVRRIIVVEGYLDFLRLYQEGFKNTVATLGTALSEDHVRVLKRFADEAIVVYDGDQAGEAAALRGLEVFLEGGMSVRVVRLPAGDDPDDFVRKQGAEAFQKMLTEAQDFFDYKMDSLLKRFGSRDSLGLMRMTSDFLETFTKIQSPVLLDGYLRRLAASLGVEETSLRSELSKLKKKNSERGGKITQAVPAPKSKKSVDEFLLFSLVIEAEKFQDAFFQEVRDDDFEEAYSKELYHLLLSMHSQQQPLGLMAILNRLEDEMLKEKLVSLTSLEWDSQEKEKAFFDCLKTLMKKRVDKKLEILRRSIAKAEREKDPARLKDYMQQYQVLWRSRTSSS